MKRQPIVLLTIAMLSAGLADCSSNLFENKLNSVEFFSKRDWGTPTKNAEADFGTSGPAAPEDYVDASGACAGAPPVPAQAQDSAVGTPPAGDLGSHAVPGAPIAGGIALGMTECQVVQRAGQPGNIQISVDANNDRATVLTYLSGTWPGIYRFSAGRLKEVERVTTPEQPKPAKPAKKKKATPKTATR